MRTYFAFTSATPVLVTTLIITVTLLGWVFPAVPVDGESLDGKPGYTYEEALAALKGYGPQGRWVYAWASMTLDTVLPVVYASFFAGLVYRLRPKASLWWLAYLPVAVGVVDVCENVQIVRLLMQYPDISAAQVASASFFTLSKHAGFILCVALAVILMANTIRERMCQNRG